MHDSVAVSASMLASTGTRSTDRAREVCAAGARVGARLGPFCRDGHARVSTASTLLISNGHPHAHTHRCTSAIRGKNWPSWDRLQEGGNLCQITPDPTAPREWELMSDCVFFPASSSARSTSFHAHHTRSPSLRPRRASRVSQALVASGASRVAVVGTPF